MSAWRKWWLKQESNENKAHINNCRYYHKWSTKNKREEDGVEDGVP